VSDLELFFLAVFVTSASRWDRVFTDACYLEYVVRLALSLDIELLLKGQPDLAPTYLLSYSNTY
jgi:hypothetical protein